MKHTNTINDSLDQSQHNYDLGMSQYSNGNPNQLTMHKLLQNTYKQQLDDINSQRKQQKLLQKQKEQKEKKQYNERMKIGQQAERMKQISYRNYYNMLLNNQRHIQNNYISPFAERDHLKQQHIELGVEQNRKKLEYLEHERRKFEAERINNYKSQLISQMEQKKKKQINSKQQIEKVHEQYRKYSRLPEQIKLMEREKKWEQMNKYKEDLDRVKKDKEVVNRSRINTMDSKSPNIQGHHPFINPLPYNIQNPYILKQINQQQRRLAPF